MWIIMFLSAQFGSYAISNYRIWLDYCLVLLFSLIQFSYKICQLYTIQLKSSSTKNNNLHPARFSLFCSHCVSAIISFDSSTSWTLNWYVLTKMLFLTLSCLPVWQWARWGRTSHLFWRISRANSASVSAGSHRELTAATASSGTNCWV